jgi:hypothetical protein
LLSLLFDLEARGNTFHQKLVNPPPDCMRSHPSCLTVTAVRISDLSCLFHFTTQIFVEVGSAVRAICVSSQVKKRQSCPCV